MYRNFYNNSLLSVALILAASAIFVTFVHDEPYDDAKSKSVERRALEKRVFSQVARDLNPKVYGEFEFRHGEIKVLRPGRLLKDFEVLEGSILLVGNGFTLTTDEALGRRRRHLGSLSRAISLLDRSGRNRAGPFHPFRLEIPDGLLHPDRARAFDECDRHRLRRSGQSACFNRGEPSVAGLYVGGSAMWSRSLEPP